MTTQEVRDINVKVVQQLIKDLQVYIADPTNVTTNQNMLITDIIYLIGVSISPGYSSIGYYKFVQLVKKLLKKEKGI